MPAPGFFKRITLFFLFLAMGFLLAPKASFGFEPNPGDIGWRVEKGRLSGEFSNQPLGEVLKSIQPYARFRFRGPETVLALPVSGKFHDEPPATVVKKILKRFNHTLLTRDDGTPQQLFVMGLRDKSGAGSEVLTRSPKSIQQEKKLAEKAFDPTPEPSEEARRAILDGAKTPMKLPTPEPSEEARRAILEGAKTPMKLPTPEPSEEARRAVLEGAKTPMKLPTPETSEEARRAILEGAKNQKNLKLPKN